MSKFDAKVVSVDYGAGTHVPFFENDSEKSARCLELALICSPKNNGSYDLVEFRFKNQRRGPYYMHIATHAPEYAQSELLSLVEEATFKMEVYRHVRTIFGFIPRFI